MNQIKELLFSLLKPYSAILFLNHKVAGAFIAMIMLINPSVAISGVVAILATLLFAKMIDFKEAYFHEGFYIYNSLLVGMGVGFLFTPSLMSLMLISIASIFTFALSFMLNRFFSIYNIPILSLPFSIVTMFVYLGSLKYSALATTLVNKAMIYDITLSWSIEYFFKSLGTIFFLPHIIVGMALSVIILYFSRILFFMMFVGFYFGVFLHSFLLGSYMQALANPYAFNYIIVAPALCGIFLLPTIRNFFIALLGVSMSVVLVDAIGVLFQYYGIPVFTLPFNITVITFIFLLSMTYYKEFNYHIKYTPEESLSAYLSSVFRFGTNSIRIALPFSGEWKVYQAFDGEWTHKGEYKYAYDFVKIKENRTYKSEGLQLNDYYAFGESILSPVGGYIVDARDDLPDNFIGEVDRVNNWGNYIIIKSDFGYFVEISHLMQHSLNIKIGDYVKVNQIIAKCGNSGYSPEPHIHIQVQSIGVINAFTKTFCFGEYYQGKQLIFNALPKQGELVSAIIINKSIYSRLIFVLDDQLSYDVYQNQEKVGEYTFSVQMNNKGEFYFEDTFKNQLYFYTDTLMFYFYNYVGEESHLKYLFILAPRIPYIHKKEVRFYDYLPLEVVYKPFKKMLIELLSAINKNAYKIEKEYVFKENQLLSNQGMMELSLYTKGFKIIKYNNTVLKRREV